MIFITSFAFSAISSEEVDGGKTTQDMKKANEDAGQLNQEKKEKETELKQPNPEEKEKKAEADQAVEDKKEKDSESEHKDQEKKEPEPSKLLKIGNLAFPPSQEPTPLISFGQNLIGEKKLQSQETVTYTKGKNEYFIDIQNAFIYGFRDDLSIFLAVPNAIRFRQDCNHTSGPEDMIVQFEYGPYTKEYYTYYDQITIVANVTIPTGSAKKNPPTGKGANSFFIGGTYARMAINWFYFTSYGGIFNASSHRTQFGNQFFYQYGLGRRIWNNDHWLFDWMLELDGTYSCRDRIQGVIDPDSGGNIFIITPSLFLASKDSLVVQLGIGFPIVQQLNGRQNKQDYVLQTKISWTF